MTDLGLKPAAPIHYVDLFYWTDIGEPSRSRGFLKGGPRTQGARTPETDRQRATSLFVFLFVCVTAWNR